jgi:hypothetical protein
MGVFFTPGSHSEKQQSGQPYLTLLATDFTESINTTQEKPKQLWQSSLLVYYLRTLVT